MSHTDKRTARPRLDPALAAAVADEVAKQINTFRQQFDADIEGIISQLMREVMGGLVRDAVKEYCDPLLRTMKSEAVTAAAAAAQTVAESHADSRALTVRNLTADLVVRHGKKIAETVRAEVMAEINEKVVPKVDNMMKYVRFNTEDPMESINDYRKDVMLRDSGARKNLLEGRITGGETKADPRGGMKISPYVGTVWGENY